ncbi:hypothetical protein QBC45DRAFT_470101 [Copromyces sp. CBS 386.78]|nr:hypothetical protein QBC45DRAFT_470101 [Copromyces sp. CBS 386.78]
MSAQGRPPPASLPPLPDEASVPFSSLFDNFDLATVDSTVQFANKGIFIASDGRRYLFQSIPVSDTPAASPANSTAPSSIHQPVTNPQSPRELHDRNNASLRGRRTSSNASSRSQASSFRTAHSGRYTTSNVSPAALDVHVAGPHSAAAAPPPPPQDVANMMSHLNINHHFNGAAPYFGESDGGVGLAEVLTERDTEPWAPESPVDNSSCNRPVSPRTAAAASNQHHRLMEFSHNYGYNNQSTQYMRTTSNLTAGLSSTAPAAQAQVTYKGNGGGHHHHVDGINYGGFVTGANFASSQGPRRQTPPTGPVLESFMESSYPQYPASPTGHHFSVPYSPTSPVLSPDSYEKEFVSSDGAHVYSSSPHSIVHEPSSPPYPGRGRGGSGSGSGVFVGVGAGAAAQNNVVSIGTSTNRIDTRTAVVVVPERHASSFSSDSRSTGRDHVLPGEDVLFDGPVKSAPTLASSAFEDGELKIFRNTTTKDLRFHCRVGTYSETFWIKARNAQLIPVYAYDPRFLNVICLHDKETEKSNPGYMSSSPIPGGPGNGNGGHPNGIYQFPRLADLCHFQAQLTGEKVLLDISNVKLIRLTKASGSGHSVVGGGGSSDTYSSVRLQIWHEDPDSTNRRRGVQSDKASFVTAGTALSGPLRDRQVASSSKLVVYLGRLGEYVQTFITDDIEVKTEGQTKVKLRPRRAGVFSREGSRWKGIKAHIEQRGDSEMTGFKIDGQPPNPDAEYGYDLYKMLEIEFENPPSKFFIFSSPKLPPFLAQMLTMVGGNFKGQDSFIRRWGEVIAERRQQREKLKVIQEELKAVGGLYGKTAMEIRM